MSEVAGEFSANAIGHSVNIRPTGHSVNIKRSRDGQYQKFPGLPYCVFLSC